MEDLLLTPSGPRCQTEVSFSRIISDKESFLEKHVHLTIWKMKKFEIEIEMKLNICIVFC